LSDYAVYCSTKKRKTC